MDPDDIRILDSITIGQSSVVRQTISYSRREPRTRRNLIIRKVPTNWAGTLHNTFLRGEV